MPVRVESFRLGGSLGGGARSICDSPGDSSGAQVVRVRIPRLSGWAASSRLDDSVPSGIIVRVRVELSEVQS